MTDRPDPVVEFERLRALAVFGLAFIAGVLAITFASRAPGGDGASKAAQTALAYGFAANLTTVAISYLAYYWFIQSRGMSEQAALSDLFEKGIEATQELVRDSATEFVAHIDNLGSAPEVTRYFNQLHKTHGAVASQLAASSEVELVAQYLSDWLAGLRGELEAFLSEPSNTLRVILVDPRSAEVASPVARQARQNSTGGIDARTWLASKVEEDIARLFRIRDEAAHKAPDGTPGTLTIELANEQINYVGMRFDSRQLLLSFLPHFGETTAPAISVDLGETNAAAEFWEREIERGFRDSSYDRLTAVHSTAEATRLFAALRVESQAADSVVPPAE